MTGPAALTVIDHSGERRSQNNTFDLGRELLNGLEVIKRDKVVLVVFDAEDLEGGRPCGSRRRYREPQLNARRGIQIAELDSSCSQSS